MSVLAIIHAVAEYYGLTSDQLLTGRTKSRVAGRQIAMLLIREYTLLSLEDVAEAFDLDVSTVRYSIRQARQRLANDPLFARDLVRIKGRLLGES